VRISNAELNPRGQECPLHKIKGSRIEGAFLVELYDVVLGGVVFSVFDFVVFDSAGSAGCGDVHAIATEGLFEICEASVGSVAITDARVQRVAGTIRWRIANCGVGIGEAFAATFGGEVCGICSIAVRDNDVFVEGAIGGATIARRGALFGPHGGFVLKGVTRHFGIFDASGGS